MLTSSLNVRLMALVCSVCNITRKEKYNFDESKYSNNLLTYKMYQPSGPSLIALALELCLCKFFVNLLLS